MFPLKYIKIVFTYDCVAAVWVTAGLVFIQREQHHIPTNADTAIRK